MRGNELYHHGIIGQRWGVRRYQNKDGSLTALGRQYYGYGDGRRSSTSEVSTTKHGSSSTKSDSRDKSKKIKTALKVGAAAAATGLAIYGGYKLAKSGKLDGVADKIGIGRKKVTEILSGDSDTINIKIDDALKEAADSVYKSTGRDITSGNIKMSDLSDVKTIGGLKVRNTPLTVDDMIASIDESAGATKVNPHLGDSLYDNDCTRCAVNAVLQYFGIDGTAYHNNGKGDLLSGVAENIFKESSRIDGQIRKLEGRNDNFVKSFTKSKEAAADKIVKRFGKNGVGVISATYKDNHGGHAFNFEIVDGVVRFFDTQRSNASVNTRIDDFWKQLDPNGEVFVGFINPATTEVNVNAIAEYSR